MAPQHLKEKHLSLRPLAERRDLAAFFSVIQELRPHLRDLDTFVNQVHAQAQEGYTLQGLFWNETPVGAAGYRLLTTLAWGKILYLDDLIVSSAYRGQGFGRYLLDALIHLARKTSCSAVHLDTGYARHTAHRLYLRYGFELNCHHLSYAL